MPIVVVQNAYGYNLKFTLQNADGTAFDLTGYTALKFNVQFANTPGQKFSGTPVVSGSPSGGILLYAVAQTDFNEAGIYQAQIEVDFAAAVQIWPDIQIKALKQIPLT